MSEPISAIGNLQIEQQVERLQQIADPAARAVATELVASVLELHGVALQKMLAILQANSNTAPLAAFEHDDLIRAVLLLHDLHSQPVSARVTQAIDELRPRVEKLGATVALAITEPNHVQATIRGSNSGCGSTAETVRSMVQAALVGAAPDAAEIVVEIADADKSFVAVESIQLARTAHS